MTKKERERQIKKAYIFYRRRVRTLGVELELCLLPDAIF